jgi:hypothetical protein
MHALYMKNVKRRLVLLFRLTGWLLKAFVIYKTVADSTLGKDVFGIGWVLL